jgi:D-xylose transport system permease protein
MAFLRALAAKLQIDGRMFGMVGALIIIWIGLDILSGGRFITPRNMFNLSVQTSSVAIMAFGMVLIIVTRQIDLSVGSILGVVAMVMGVVQSDFLPSLLGLGHPATVVLTIASGIVVGAAIGAVHGWVIGYLGVPSFIVTLGGLLIWRGAAWWVTQGRTVAPLDANFILLGGGFEGTIGATASWVLAAIGVVALTVMLIRARRRRIAFGFPVKPAWAEVVNGCLLSGVLIAFVATVNAYPVPRIAAERIAAASGMAVPPEGLFIAHGLAIPVLIVILVALVMAVVLNRTRFGRYIFAMGGNPEAAERAGIDTRRMTLWAFVVMGILCALSAVVASARLQSAGNDIGTLDELRVIAAAVIGGCSLAGGVGTIFGALLGAVVIQSLQSGMALLGIDTSLQSIVTGLVLVLAVYADQLYQRNRKAG